MYVIKRYPNRKLYDTIAKQYVTLESIAELIRGGNDVQVIDHTTGEDLTALTFSQIIFEQEKRQSGFLPRSILSNLIQAGGDRLSSLQRSLVSPKALLQHVDEEIKRRIQALIAQGELMEAEGDRLLDKLTPESRHDASSVAITDEDLYRLLQEQDIPSREEVDHIVSQLDALADKLDELSQSSR